MKALFVLPILALAAASRAILVIDDFTTGAASMTNLGDYTQSGSMFGGMRSVSLRNISNPLSQSFQFTIGGGNAILDSGAELSTSLDINYGAVPSFSYGANLGVNLTSIGNTFNIFGIYADQPTSIGLYVYTSPTRFSFRTLTLPTSGMLTIPFGTFGYYASGGPADFANVNGVRLSFDSTTPSLDMKLSSLVVGTVPEPSSFASLTLGAVFLYRRRHSRR